MVNRRDESRDLAGLVVPNSGALEETGDPWVPYRLLDGDGAEVEPVSAYLADLQAAGGSMATLRSYGHDLLRWWRFLAAVDVRWNRAVQTDARDFARWMQIADKPRRSHWRRRAGAAAIESGAEYERPERPAPAPGTINQVTGKATPGRRFAPSTRDHAETVLRSFYDFHLEAGTGPIVNPFPLDRSRRGRRANAHHNPLEPFKNERKGRYRARAPKRLPRRIPDEKFNEVFAGLKYDRDRALLAFWISTAARASELLTVPQDRVNPGDQMIAVVRKGSGALQWLPASADSFVWLRLYQQELWRKGAPRGGSEPLWLTLRRPWRELSYHGARAMFVRAQEALGSNWTLHDLRHSAAWRMAQDPEMPLTDVQWILNHASLSTTQLYTLPSQQEVIASALAHHERRSRTPVAPPPSAEGYNAESLRILFGGR